MAEATWHGLIWKPRAGRDWTPEEKLLGAYLLSGPATNRIGCYLLDLDTATNETGLSADQIAESLANFEQDGFCRRDRNSGWIWLPELLEQHPFAELDEVRRALPELASVPRTADFHQDLVIKFRASADRPGAVMPPKDEAAWIAGILGDSRASELAQRLAHRHTVLRKHLPGLPSLSATTLHPLAKLAIILLDYSKRCKMFFIETVNTKPLRILGLLAIICAILFVVFPGIDLGVAGWFYKPPRSFTLGETWVGRFFDGEVHFAMEWFLVLFVAVYLVSEIKRRTFFGIDRKRFIYITLSIALGAGLLTNVVLKDNWGRARPSQVAEFGGPKQFTPPFMRSTQCDKNCSFISGDASLATTFLAFAVVADRNRRRWFAGLGGFTIVVGIMRMARGSHFLSDVVFAVIFNLMVVLVLERLIMQDRWRNWPRVRSVQVEPPEP